MKKRKELKQELVEILSRIRVCRTFTLDGLQRVMEHTNAQTKPVELIWLVGELSAEEFILSSGSQYFIVNSDAIESIDKINEFPSDRSLHAAWRDCYNSKFEQSLKAEDLAALLYHELVYGVLWERNIDNISNFFESKVQDYLWMYYQTVAESLDIASSPFRSDLREAFIIIVSSLTSKYQKLRKEFTEFIPALTQEIRSIYNANHFKDVLSPADYDSLNDFLALLAPPIEIAVQGESAIRDYFNAIEGEKQALNEVKVLLVGNGGAGKTSLVKQLVGEAFDPHELQTHGICIKDWTLALDDETLSLHFWDFGGQEIMHATHQFFLSKRSLYILVLDGRKDEEPEYWLKYIESFGGDSPILVVLNKIDHNPSFDINRRFLLEKYSTIKGFCRVSCATGLGIADVLVILKAALLDVEILGTLWPQSWFIIKKQLEGMGDDFISYDQYKDLCEKEKIIERTRQRTLVSFLNDLGVILHFEDFELFDTHVLNPKWVTHAVYKVINSKQLAHNHGFLRLDLLEDILRKRTEGDYEYPRDKFCYIIDLMKKFEICYEVDQELLLIPDLLVVQEPQINFNYAKSLKFIIEYDFLPKSIMPRFIVRTHNDIKENLCWRTGVVLSDGIFGTTAVIKADGRDKRIYIYVSGNQQRDHLSVIRKTLNNIHKDFEKLRVSELVPLPGNDDVTVEYAELIGLDRMGETRITIGKLGKKYNVKQLLDGIEKKSYREESLSQNEKVTKIVHVHEGAQYYEQMEGADMKKENLQKNNAWVNGSFYLVVAIVVMTTFAVISKNVQWYALPIVFIGGLLTVSIIGALQLKNDESLSEKNFLTLMVETFKRLPLLKSEKIKPPKKK